jgi:predicted RNA-binding Zn-ribbon protein involved in translation (DUF1610 family)
VRDAGEARRDESKRSENTMAGKAKTADRTRTVESGQEIPCPECGKPARVVKRVKNRELGIAGGMYYSCTACDFAQKK